MMECWWLLGKNDSIGTLRPHEWERIEEEIWEKTDCHKQDVTTFPCVMKGEALNYFGDLRFGGRRSAVRLSAELTLPSLCCVLYCGTRRWILCSRWKPACSRPEDHYSLCVRVFVELRALSSTALSCTHCVIVRNPSLCADREAEPRGSWTGRIRSSYKL